MALVLCSGRGGVIDEFVHSPMKAANFFRQCDRTYKFWPIAISLSLLSPAVCACVCIHVSELLCHGDPIDPRPTFWDPIDPSASSRDPDDPSNSMPIPLLGIHIL